MAIARVGATNNGTIPSGTASGNFILIAAFNSSSTTIPTTPSGWSSATSATNSSSATISMNVIWKAATGSDTYPTITNATSSVCCTWSGVNTSAPLVQIAGQSSSGSTTSISYSGIVTYQHAGVDWVITVGCGTPITSAIGSHPATSMTLPTNGEYSTGSDDVAIFDSNGALSSYSFNTKTLSAAATSMTKTLELVASTTSTPTNLFFYM